MRVSGTRERAAEVAASTEELRAALWGHGITLPSLGVDPVTFAGLYPYPLVQLGCCNLDAASRLAYVLCVARGTAR